MKKLFVLLALLALFLSVGVDVWAKEKPKKVAEVEDKPAEVTVSDLEILSNKIGDLSKYAKVGLLLQGQAINSGTNPLLPKGFSAPIKPAAGVPFYNDMFAGKRTEVSLFGDLSEKKIAYRIQYDLLATTTAKAGVSNGEQVKDYWIKFSYIPNVDIQFGQFKFAQALEGRTSTGELDFNNTALITTALESRRDLSLQLSGSKIPVGPINVEYAAALVQGAGQNALENNDAKDFAGRFGLTITDPGWTLFAGVSGYAGWEGTLTAAPGFRDNTGYEIRFVEDTFKLQAEFIQGRLEPGNNYNPSATLQSLVQGFYVTAQYRYKDFRFGLRGESYNSNFTASFANGNFNNDVLTAGVDSFRSKDKFKLTVNYENHLQQYEAIIGQAQINI